MLPIPGTANISDLEEKRRRRQHPAHAGVPRIKTQRLEKLFAL
jgi:hypothetical protein